MKRLIIMGAGGCGREILQLALDINEKTPRWSFFGFLDYDIDALKGKESVAEIIGNDDNYDIQASDEFVCAVGNGSLRKKIMEKMEGRGAKFISLLHPAAIISRSAKLGEGVVIYPYSQITADTSIGKGCLINMNCTIGHDVTVGEFCTVSPGCNITGMCRIGSNVFMGVGTQIVPSVRIEDNAYLCAGSVVMMKVRAGQKVMGNPAKQVPTFG